MQANRIGVLVMAAFAVATIDSNASTIYRCSDGAGRVLYSDTPCRGGTVVEIDARPYDPAARERLDRDLEAFDRRQAARSIELARQKERQEEALRRRLQAEAAQAPAPDAAPSYAYGWGYAPYAYVPPPRPRPLPRPPVPVRDRYIVVR